MPLPPGYTWKQDWNNYGPVNGFREPTREDVDFDKQTAQTESELFKQWDWQNADGLGPQGQEMPKYAIGWKPNGEADFGTGLGGWWKKVKSNVETAYQTGYEEGIKISGVEKIAIKTGAQAAGADADKLIAEKEASRKPQTEGQAQAAALAEGAKAAFGELIWGVLEGLSQPAIIAEQALGTAGHTLDRLQLGQEVNKETITKDWHASRLAYSQMFDASIYEEMNRRIEAGIRPDLAAQEVMIANPQTLWPELIGQVLLDPLNAVTIFTKAGQALKIEKNVKKTFQVVENADIARLIDDVADMENLDDATAYKNIQELVTNQQNLTTLKSHADDVAQAGKDINALSRSYNIAQMTSTGKAAKLANESGEILMHIVNNAGPEEALEIMRGMVMSVSDNVDEAAEGVSTMLHFADAKALFSEAGNNTTVLLSQMVKNHGATWLDDIAALKDNPSELAKNLLTKLEKTTEEMFPSVSSMLKAEDDIKAGVQLADAKAIERRAALAQRAAELPASVRAATKFHDAAQKVVGPINKFFVNVYMGWSPGYAFRNFSNNSLQLLIDYGPGVLLGNTDEMFAKASRFDFGGAANSIMKSADTMFAEAEKIHGGVIQGAFSEGGDIAALFPEKIGGRDTTVKAALQAAAGKKSSPILAASQVAEANAAKRILAKTYMKTFEQGTRAMVKSVSGALREAGFSDDLIKKLPTYIMQNDGDAAKVIEALRADVGNGVIDMFNDIDRIDPKYKSFLNDVGKWDEYAEQVLKAENKETAALAAQKIFDDIAQAGDYVYREGRPAVDQYDKFLKMAEKSGLPETRGQLISLRKTESRKAIQAAEAILAEADDLGSQLGLQVGTMKKARNITGLNTWGNDAAKEADRLNDMAWMLTEQSKKNANLNQLWMGYPEFFPGQPPANLDARTFRDALWAQYDTVVSQTWGGARDTAIDSVIGYLDDLKAAGAPVNDAWYESIKAAQEGAQQYDTAMIGRFGELVEETPMPYGSRTTQISQMANQYGIGTANEAGVATDKKTLSLINKYAETSYKSLEEVPLDVAEQAFKSKTVKKTPKVTTSDTGQNLVDEATDVPRSELPEDVSQRFADEAKRLANELSGGEGGKRTAEGSFGTTNVSWYRELAKKGLTKKAIDKALDKIVMDAGKDKGVNVERMKDLIMDNFKMGDATNGVPPDLNVLKQLGADEKTLQEALDNFNDITKQDVTLEEAIRQSGGDVADDLRNPDLPYYNEAGELVEPARKRILPPPSEDAAPPISRAIYDQKDKVTEMRKWVMDDIEKNFGKKQLLNKTDEKALRLAEKELKTKLAETKLISSRVAQANRDFTLLNYGEKSYWDVALAYLYPFHYWYKGTYKNWLSRVASNPAILAHYAKYKENLGTVHAGMPEWWKYNINTNDLPGVNVENPLYFNLEATLWPLNGITGMDFNDSSKRVNWWTYGLDFANKFGPSTWSPISMVTGLMLNAKGEEEAGEKWLGRLIPQSNVIKAGGSLLGIANLEIDPYVRMFGEGNLDPYERRRAQRALSNMMMDAEAGKSLYTKEQIMDAAYSQSGEIWDEAVRNSVRGRAPSNVSSFLFGVGFKGRTEQDMQIDKYYADYGKLITMRPNLSPEEYKEGMDALKKKYPFADTVALATKSGEARDSALAYSVLNRIPPGSTSDVMEAAGIDQQMMNKFFDSKGNLDSWSQADRQKFMAGVLNISAVLEIPSDMTKAEWSEAKKAYSSLSTEAKNRFGDNILDEVDAYYAAKTRNRELGDAYLEKHPNVEQYMNWRSERIINSPLLSAYYGGASMIENYTRSQMYEDIEKQLGKEIFDTVSTYNDLKTYGEGNEAKQFYNQHKAEIKKYYALKDQWQMTINQTTAQLSNYIPEGQPAGIREDYDATSMGQQGLVDALQPEQGYSYEDFRAIIPPRLFSLTEDYFYSGERLPESAERQLERIARELNYPDVDALLQDVGSTLYEGAQP